MRIGTVYPQNIQEVGTEAVLAGDAQGPFLYQNVCSEESHFTSYALASFLMKQKEAQSSAVSRS